MSMGGRLTEDHRIIRAQIERTIEDRGLPARLAERIARQLVFKFDIPALGDRSTWRAVGELLRREAERLQAQLGLVERQIVVALPKLSATQIFEFFEELRSSDPTIARTILNAALDAADPVAVGRRYLDGFHSVVDELTKIDPGIARTLANATFMAHAPREKAMSHFKRFVDLMMRFRDDVEFVRTVAKAAFRAPDPVQAAEGFIAEYDAIVAELTSTGVESSIARSLAAIASLSADPLPTARKLLQNFEAVVALAKETHPQVARSIALSACRATEPLRAARLYMNNYDTIIRVIGETDRRRAGVVAAQAFRSDNPLRWAKRYLAKLRAAEVRDHQPRTGRPSRPLSTRTSPLS
jgi:hypothetical protein